MAWNILSGVGAGLLLNRLAIWRVFEMHVLFIAELPFSTRSSLIPMPRHLKHFLLRILCPSSPRTDKVFSRFTIWLKVLHACSNSKKSKSPMIARSSAKEITRSIPLTSTCSFEKKLSIYRLKTISLIEDPCGMLLMGFASQ